MKQQISNLQIDQQLKRNNNSEIGIATKYECTTIQIKHATHLSLKETVIQASIQYA